MPALPTPPGSDSPGLFARKFGADQEFVHGKRLQSRKSRPPQRAPADNLLDTQKIICWQAKNARKNSAIPVQSARKRRARRSGGARIIRPHRARAPGACPALLHAPGPCSQSWAKQHARHPDRFRDTSRRSENDGPSATVWVKMSGLRCLVYDVWSTRVIRTRPMYGGDFSVSSPTRSGEFGRT